MPHRGISLVLLTAFAPIAAAAAATFSDPAAQKIDTFDAALIQTMKAGDAAGANGRFKTIAPAVDATFNIPVMVGFAAGPSWASTSAEDKSALTAAFRRYTIANYAKNFSSYDGQKLAVTPEVQTRGVDKLVKTQLTSGSGGVVTLVYRMRQAGDAWKVIDVLYNGSISQLTTQRSDFASTLSAGGPKALAAKLDAQADKLLR